MKKMKFITNFFIKNLDPGSSTAWIRNQQQPGSGISNSLDPEPQQQLGSGSAAKAWFRIRIQQNTWNRIWIP